LSQDPLTAARRLLRAAAAARLAGENEAARTAIAAALERSDDPLLRSDAMALQLEIDAWRRPVATAATIVAEAEGIAEVDELRAVRLMAEAAGALLRSGSVPQGVEIAQRASARLAEHGRSHPGVAFALMFGRVMDGDAAIVADDVEALGLGLLGEA